jgi:hypothetical protein
MPMARICPMAYRSARHRYQPRLRDSYRYVTFLQLRPGASPAGLPARLNRDTPAEYARGHRCRLSPPAAEKDAFVQRRRLRRRCADRHYFYDRRPADPVDRLHQLCQSVDSPGHATQQGGEHAQDRGRGKDPSVPAVCRRNGFVISVFRRILAVVLVALAMPLFNQVAGKQLVFDIANGAMWMVVGCIDRDYACWHPASTPRCSSPPSIR